MLAINTDWVPQKHVKIRSIKNREIVTIRANLYKKITLHISIGLVICELLGFKKNERVNVFINRKDQNILLIKKKQYSL